MILHDFHCDHCDKTFEELVKSDQRVTACACGQEAGRIMSAPKTFHEIVPTTNTSKRLKAGYVHHFPKKRPDAPVMVQVPRGIP